MCDRIGRPIKFILTGGQLNDCTQALSLLAGMSGNHIIADKGYDADYIVNAVHAMGAQAVIPPMRHRRIQRAYCTELYKKRNLIERLFSKMKQFRRIATRYDKLAINFQSFVYFCAVWLWIK